nr:hypothetical protein [uncultured Rhodoferax sp.]
MTWLSSLEQIEVVRREFALKRSNFVLDHELESQPMLIWQAMSVAQQEIDFTSPTARAALQKGTAANRESWWFGFCGGPYPTAIFDGLAAPQDSSQGWRTELHKDGHLLAGVWNFHADLRSSGDRPVVQDFYREAFADFGSLAENAYSAVGIPDEILIYCSMRHANKVDFARRGPIPRGSVQVRRETLEWPIRCAKNPGELKTLAKLMEDDFMALYGVLPTRGQ